MLIFCYGSNGKKQLKKRLGHSIDMLPAVAINWKRVYRGYSELWRGGVASIIKKKGSKVYGGVIQASKKDMEELDYYEGVNHEQPENSFYTLETIEIIVLVKGIQYKKKAGVYLCTATDHNRPSKKYLKNCAMTVSSLWRNKDGSKITYKNFEVS